jgi:hypothetical protein
VEVKLAVVSAAWGSLGAIDPKANNTGIGERNLLPVEALSNCSSSSGEARATMLASSGQQSGVLGLPGAFRAHLLPNFQGLAKLLQLVAHFLFAKRKWRWQKHNFPGRQIRLDHFGNRLLAVFRQEIRRN